MRPFFLAIANYVIVYMQWGPAQSAGYVFYRALVTVLWEGNEGVRVYQFLRLGDFCMITSTSTSSVARILGKGEL